MERTDRNPLTEASSQSPARTGGGEMPQKGRYGAQARYYDYEYRTYTDDVPYYLERLRLLPKACRVLELGVGTGRVAFPLVEAGYTVVGIDLSLPMLRRARQRRNSLPPDAATRLSLHQADLLSWKSSGGFQAALAPFSFLCLLPTRALRQAALRRVFQLLEPGGLCVVDVFNVQPREAQVREAQPREAQPREAQPREAQVREAQVREAQAGQDGSGPSIRSYQQTFAIPPYGHQVHKTVTEQLFPDLGHQQVQYHYEERDWSGARCIRSLDVEFLLASVPEDELLADFLDAGFEIEGLSGDYQGRPLGPKSGRLIVTGQKRAGKPSGPG